MSSSLFVLLLASTTLTAPRFAVAQSSPAVLAGCFVVERVDGGQLPLPSPFEILVVSSSGNAESGSEAVTPLPAIAQQVSPNQIRGTWMGRGGKRSAFFEFSIFQDRLRGTLWLTAELDEPRPFEVDARPTACPEPIPPL